MAVRNIVNRHLALLFGESPVLAMPTDHGSLAAENGTLLGYDKTFVLLECSVDAVPGVGPLAIPIGDAIKAVEDSAVMRRMDLGIVVQASSDNPVSTGRKHVMKNFIGPNA